MKGAIIGDIVGSIYEWHNIKTKDFPLFAPNCFFTDDSIMTMAVGRAFMNSKGEADFPEELVYQMRLFGHMYPPRRLRWAVQEVAARRGAAPLQQLRQRRGHALLPRRADRVLSGGGGGAWPAHRRGHAQPPRGHQGGAYHSGSDLLGP